MQKKYVILIGAMSIALLAAVTLGFFYLNTTQTPPPPMYAFASDREGAGDIFVRDAQDEIRNLTEHPAADWDPAWSVDGKTIAFTSHRTGNSDIWLLDVLEPEEENEPRNLTDHPAWDYSATWSPSGQTVAFVSERDGDPEIFVQSVESDTAIQLTFNKEKDHLPAWSPDGKMIAYAGMRDGVEQIYLIRPDGTDEQLATPPSLKGTSPAWSPDSQRLAFVGWDDENRAGIYIIGPSFEALEQVYQASSWIGSLNWTADKNWLTFTAWASGNHEAYAIPAEGGSSTRLTFDEAWDDFLAVNPQANFLPVSQDSLAQAAPAVRLPQNPEFAAGVNMADLSKVYLINDLGMGWGKGYVNWATVEPEMGEFRWVDPDNVVEAFSDQGIKILMRIHGTPSWARPVDSSYTHPPEDVEDFAKFMAALASRYKGQVSAYEIWNEPNLSYEWGNLPPDPKAYTAMLKAAYQAVKAVDPEALVITGGLATTGGGSPTAYGDLDFLQDLYGAGAGDYFDAVGSHPYTFGRSPHETDPWGLSLSRVDEQYEVMTAHGDGEKPIWITELGWVVQSNWDLGEHQDISVSEAQQAEYLVDAYATVMRARPYVRGLFLFNLDFSTVAWYPAQEPMRWYAILNPDRTPRAAYTELRAYMRSQ